MTPCYLGPYIVRSHSSTGNYYLINCHSHVLKKSVPASQLVHFYDNKGSYGNNTQKRSDISAYTENSYDGMSSSTDIESDVDRVILVKEPSSMTNSCIPN